MLFMDKSEMSVLPAGCPHMTKSLKHGLWSFCQSCLLLGPMVLVAKLFSNPNNTRQGIATRMIHGHRRIWAKNSQFHAVFWKIWQNPMLVPPGRLAPPPSENPISFPVVRLVSKIYPWQWRVQHFPERHKPIILPTMPRKLHEIRPWGGGGTHVSHALWIH